MAEFFKQFGPFAGIGLLGGLAIGYLHNLDASMVLLATLVVAVTTQLIYQGGNKIYQWHSNRNAGKETNTPPADDRPTAPQPPPTD